MWEIARAWVDGWTVSRRTPKPVGAPWGLSIQVGLPAQAVRHVLLDDADAETVLGLVGAITQPTTCVKAFLEPNAMEPWFSPEWEPTDPGFLMAVDLRASAVRAPDGYTVTTATVDEVMSVRILAADGALAAGGRIGLTGAACVFDQIITEEAHRRRGLGTVVMGALTNAAVEHGVATGILGATVPGRALYEALDWKVLAPLTGFTYKPVAT
ncbi:GNAT family N-acetyltransferase [Streptomyces sp. DK15]|uniref:GNAT family N-acetyltransferase n=1 Tax=Streptomyces sp. DK15 TaxID=2957499 RepID=UPI0029BE493E|nr:GNAT family N-acetyltransferase [Streptomyces sp. DK15]MDX2395052.1 GNAT family N-acetyltransferase [Streptomyces sp. DK15]